MPVATHNLIVDLNYFRYAWLMAGQTFPYSSFLRSDASKCPKELQLEQVTDWLKTAIRKGDVSAAVDLFPEYVWIRIEGQAFEARLSNSVLGQYKGYPILDNEAPRWLG